MRSGALQVRLLRAIGKTTECALQDGPPQDRGAPKATRDRLSDVLTMARPAKWILPEVAELADQLSSDWADEWFLEKADSEPGVAGTRTRMPRPRPA